MLTVQFGFVGNRPYEIARFETVNMTYGNVKSIHAIGRWWRGFIGLSVSYGPIRALVLLRRMGC